MSCYIRHMNDFLGDIDIVPNTKEERKEIDLAIREAIGKDSLDQCNVVWKEVKIWLNDENKKTRLAIALKNSMI
ncbi:hypothetical protein [Methanobacterium sp.]|uniref:hypothetical protein n=1 Tax=Methanobacterium sp. TaxID=2164 RepID=UPI003C716D06